MGDEDLEEMRSLRKAQKFKDHQAIFGDRAQAKARTERAREEIAAQKLVRLQVEDEKLKKQDAKEEKTDDSETPDQMRGMLPLEFGKKAKTPKAPKLKKVDLGNNKKKAAEEDKEPEKLEAPTPEMNDDPVVDDGDRPMEPTSTFSAENNPYKLPITHEASMSGHTKAVSALAIDRKGARLLTGSYDYSLRMHDFQGMNVTMQAFRTLEPEEGHQIRQLQWSLRADRFLCVTGSARPKVYEREGKEKCQLARGDMYLYDLKNTWGHVTQCSGGWWHPEEYNTLITSGEDGTVRIWDTEVSKKNFAVLQHKCKGKRAPVTACAYNHDGSIIASGGQDGSIQLWKSAGPSYQRPSQIVEKAHQPLMGPSSLTFSANGQKLLSRGGDETLKVWDMRKFKEPLKVFEDLPNDYAQTDVLFSPNGNVFVTGVSNKSKQGNGALVFFDATELKEIQRVSVTKESVSRLLWHPELNQILVGCSDSTIKILFDPVLSQRGVLLCVGKAPRKKHPVDFYDIMDIRHPHALPMYKDYDMKKKGATPTDGMRRRMFPAKPKTTIPGVGIGGELASRSLTGHFMKNLATRQMMFKDQDPREEILKYADAAAQEPLFVQRAYTRTQPVTVLQELPDELLKKEDELNDRIQQLGEKRKRDVMGVEYDIKPVRPVKDD